MRQPALSSVAARVSKPIDALATREVIAIPPKEIPRRAIAKRSRAVFAISRPIGIRMAPAAAIRTPNTMAALSPQPTSLEFSCIQAVKVLSMGFTALKNSSMGSLRVSPAIAIALNMRFCCMMS